jgi:hypothetical protein
LCAPLIPLSPFSPQRGDKGELRMPAALVFRLSAAAAAVSWGVSRVVSVIHESYINDI